MSIQAVVGIFGLGMFFGAVLVTIGFLAGRRSTKKL